MFWCYRTLSLFYSFLFCLLAVCAISFSIYPRLSVGRGKYIYLELGRERRAGGQNKGTVARLIYTAQYTQYPLTGGHFSHSIQGQTWKDETNRVGWSALINIPDLGVIEFEKHELLIVWSLASSTIVRNRQNFTSFGGGGWLRFFLFCFPKKPNMARPENPKKQTERSCKVVWKF
jgi:hypothetical protein